MFSEPLLLCVQGHNIFSNLSSREYGDLMQLLKQSILATDLTLYFEYVLYCIRQMGFEINIFDDIVSYSIKRSAVSLVVLSILLFFYIPT